MVATDPTLVLVDPNGSLRESKYAMPYTPYRAVTDRIVQSDERLERSQYSAADPWLLPPDGALTLTLDIGDGGYR
ncbi:MAG TPA: hypothetical protein VNL71_06500, partial [Chloroflexota bacterium]|nr:hypothetical protein [Chloroflexota bacterium]